MTRYPGAIWKPITKNYTARKRARTDCVILHIAVSESETLHGWFDNPAAGSSSHLYVRRSGITEQYIDMDYISWANGEGNPRSITVETQGMGDGTWTAAQVAKLAEICRWANTQYGVPLQLMSDSKKSSRGVGYHRLGCDPWRVQGGERWSKAYGKICPGPERIPQIPGIISLAKAGNIQHASTTITEEKDWFDMATKEELKEVVEAAIKGNSQWAEMGYDGANAKKVHHDTRAGAQAAYSNTVQLKGQVRALTDVVTELTARTTPISAEDIKGMLQRIEDRTVDTIAADYELTRKEG